MNNKDKLPKLVDVFRPYNLLIKRQLPLVVDENLTLVMDMKNSDIICDNQLLRGKELDEFACKWNMLSNDELKKALRIPFPQLMKILKQNVPCVGCRRSVEKMYFQLHRSGDPTLDPLIIRVNGEIAIREEKLTYQVVGPMLQGHASRLDKLIESQPKRNKKSVRCLLHSLDSQRSRPLTPIWRDVWESMKIECRKDVCIIESIMLYSTLETYLRKHRFCTECRTKVLKAYALLVEEPEPCKEKGYVPSLYAGLKRCIPNKHIHLQTKTEYIAKLISRAEPELLGSFSRRERHAKTLEIAQEEVLTCLGICIYERLHRIYIGMREIQCTCQWFGTVAVDTLSRNFEMAVERKRGITKLELFYAEFEQEEQEKLWRKEQKKNKRKRKKGNKSALVGEEGKLEEDESEKECSCSPTTKTTTMATATESDENKDSMLYYSCDLNGAQEESCVDCEKGKLHDYWLNHCKCETNKENHQSNLASVSETGCQCDELTAARTHPQREFNNKKENGSLNSDHSHDCGYSSENNNGCCETVSLISSLSNSPDGSELACSDGCCQQEGDYFINSNRLLYGKGNSQQPSLQEMLDGDDDNSDYYIPPEEVTAFKSNSREVYEKRQELRETLQKRFAQFCINGPLQVPRLLVQTKYASN